MGRRSLIVREGGGMSTVAKVAVAVVVCWAGLHVLPMILGAGFVVGILGMAFVGLLMGALSWVLSIGLWLGVPVLVIAVIAALVSED